MTRRRKKEEIVLGSKDLGLDWNEKTGGLSLKV